MSIIKHHKTLFIILVLVIVFVLLIWAGYQAGWTGFKVKTLWDWMQLLIIPLVLSIGALLYNRSMKKADNAHALEQYREKTLATFIDRMADMILKNELQESKEWGPMGVARARILNALRDLDGERKGHLIRFLYDSGVIANEQRKFKSRVYLSYADLSEANLENIHLEHVPLFHANLKQANLKNAKLTNTYLVEANLEGANLEDADMESVNLKKANLKGVNLKYANLKNAYLIGADITVEELSEAMFLDNATLPSGITYEEWVAKRKPDWNNAKNKDIKISD